MELCKDTKETHDGAMPGVLITRIFSPATKPSKSFISSILNRIYLSVIIYGTYLRFK